MIQKAITALVFCIQTFLLHAQHTISISQQNLAASPNGLVTLQFTLDEKLTEKEQQDALQWIKENPVLSLVINKTDVVFSIPAAHREGSTFEKLFFLMNIQVFNLPPLAGKASPVSIKEFLEFYDL